MIAVFSDRSTTASALLDNGACVDAMDDKGRTSMCHAARYGSTDCIHVLAEHGADVFAVDEEGMSPLGIAEQHSRMGAAAALRKLEQRQRLQDKRLLRQKLDSQAAAKQGPSVSQEQADMNMEALLRELEDADHREQEKKAAKKAKKKGKKAANKKAEPSEAGSTDAASSANGDKGCGSNSSKKAGKHRGSGGSSHAADGEEGLSEETSGKAPAPPPGEDVAALQEAALRETWAGLLEEAVGCMDVARLAELTDAIGGMMEQVAAAGVSTKYGKKVLQKIGKVAPAKQQLAKAMAKKDVPIAELQAAVESANAVRRHLPPGSVEEAEGRLARLQQEKEEAKWAKLKADLGVGPAVNVIKGAAVPAALASALGPAADGSHDDECIVCLAAVKDAVLIPCGHICMCFECSKQVQSTSNLCPICRADIDHAFQVL
mmetsp:Transcript_22077/g.55586  ORF Transcript_22077/g.55586 Transcript_22077/m.55586 type:complete len:432 (+) Transcript_22077:115-1410(+)